MTTTEQNELIAAFEDYAGRRAMACCLDRAEDASPERPYTSPHTNDLLSLYRAGYAQARCVYGQLAPL